MRLGRKIKGMLDTAQLRYLYLKGIHPSVQGQVYLADWTCS